MVLIPGRQRGGLVVRGLGRLVTDAVDAPGARTLVRSVDDVLGLITSKREQIVDARGDIDMVVANG